VSGRGLALLARAELRGRRLRAMMFVGVVTMFAAAATWRCAS